MEALPDTAEQTMYCGADYLACQAKLTVFALFMQSHVCVASLFYRFL